MSTQSSVRKRAIELPLLQKKKLTATQVNDNKKSTWGGRSTLSILITVSIILILLMIVNLLLTEAPIQPISSNLHAIPALTGPLKRNANLTRVEYLFKNQLKGPESLVFYKGDLITGTADGKLWRVNLQDETLVEIKTPWKKPCGKADAEHVCGRVLGLRLKQMDGVDYLFVVDTYYGVFRMDFNGNVETLLLSSESVGGFQSKFLNDVEITDNHKAYVTDSSTKWTRKNFLYTILEGVPNGRIIEIDLKTNIKRVAHAGFVFPNGLTLMHEENKPSDHILFIETGKARLLRYKFRGSDKGKVDTFVDNLPGIPDNIRKSKDGYWIGFANLRSPIFNFIMNNPCINQIVSKLLSIDWIMKLSPRYGIIVEVDKSGKILRSHQDPTGKHITYISEIEQRGESLYLGSFRNNFLGKLNLKSAK